MMKYEFVQSVYGSECILLYVQVNLMSCTPDKLRLNPENWIKYYDQVWKHPSMSDHDILGQDRS